MTNSSQRDVNRHGIYNFMSLQVEECPLSPFLHPVVYNVDVLPGSPSWVMRKRCTAWRQWSRDAMPALSIAYFQTCVHERNKFLLL